VSNESFPETLVILGACGTSRESYWVVREESPRTRVVFVEDVSDVLHLDVLGEQIPVIKDWDFSRVRKEAGGGDPDTFTQFICGMGSPRVKRIMVERALEIGLRPAPSIISSRAVLRPDVRFGRGGVVFPTSVFTSNIQVGDFVHNLMGIVGHDCVIGDYATVGSGCCIAGHVTLGEGVCLGFSTMIRQRLTIAPWVESGMGAVITRDIAEEGVTVVGVPARELRKVNGTT
jgi:sugar O-acyltransferase (sialic acid O-acetyltransferase NeuD family)